MGERLHPLAEVLAQSPCVNVELIGKCAIIRSYTAVYFNNKATCLMRVLCIPYLCCVYPPEAIETEPVQLLLLDCSEVKEMRNSEIQSQSKPGQARCMCLGFNS